MITRVGIADLASICPNCLTVVECGPIEKSSVIDCTNPDCNFNFFLPARYVNPRDSDTSTGEKSSCRKCENEAHGTISCEEYEQGKKQTSCASDALRESIRIAIERLITLSIERGTVRLEIEKMLTEALLQPRT